LFPEFREACDPKFGNSARHDAGEMIKVWRDIEGEPMQRHPPLYPHAQGADLGLIRAVADPNADPPGRAVGGDSELAKRVDHPAFEAMDEAADVLSAPFQVEPAAPRRSPGQTVVRWVTTTDHKVIGNLYFITSFFFFRHSTDVSISPVLAE